MLLNDAVREYLEYYLSSDIETDFAILLNGSWGAGKTHFIKNYFKEREDKAKSAYSQHSSGHLYASLYGIRSTSEITDQFFAQAHPVMNSTAARLIGTGVSRLLNGFAGTDVNSSEENKSLIKQMMLNLKGRVLIFDDLERCAVPLAEVMGFINSFVEHEGLKVIVIANENDIPEEQRIDYSRKKEKLIGKTLQVASDPETVLNAFCEKLTHPQVLKTVRQETPTLLATFARSEKQNFRSLRAILTDYERLVSAVDRRLEESPAAMAQLLLFMIATGIEFRGGYLNAFELANLSDIRRECLIAAITKKEKKPEIAKIEKLQAQYPDVKWDDPIIPPVALAKLFEAGIVAVDAINEHLSTHPLVMGYESVPAWRQLWNWSDLSSSQYIEARNELIRQIKARELTHPGVILHVAGIVIRSVEFDDYMLSDQGEDVSKEGVVEYFKKYIQELQQSCKLEPDRTIFTWREGGYQGLGYGSQDTSEFKAIYEIVQVATKISFAEYMKNIAGMFIERISKDKESYSLLHNNRFEEGKYSMDPFLHYIDTEDFVSVLVKDSVIDASLLASLYFRFEMDKCNRVLRDEYEWIKKLKNRLEVVAHQADPPHRKIMAGRIKYYFDGIEQMINE